MKSKRGFSQALFSRTKAIAAISFHPSQQLHPLHQLPIRCQSVFPKKSDRSNLISSFSTATSATNPLPTLHPLHPLPIRCQHFILLNSYIRYIRYLSAANLFSRRRAIAAISFHPSQQLHPLPIRCQRFIRYIRYQSAANISSFSTATSAISKFKILKRSNSKLKTQTSRGRSGPLARPLFYFQTSRRSLLNSYIRVNPLPIRCQTSRGRSGPLAPPLFYFQTSRRSLLNRYIRVNPLPIRCQTSRGRSGPLARPLFYFQTSRRSLNSKFKTQISKLKTPGPSPRPVRRSGYFILKISILQNKLSCPCFISASFFYKGKLPSLNALINCAFSRD
ncbi:MAG: hypothetical protein F6J93_06215 [Oscillatoria sp. SIO1A7]|nr:hypothetical protein [Oscillatoria sp. SIO1A7]